MFREKISIPDKIRESTKGRALEVRAKGNSSFVEVN